MYSIQWQESGKWQLSLIETTNERKNKKFKLTTKKRTIGIWALRNFWVFISLVGEIKNASWASEVVILLIKIVYAYQRLNTNVQRAFEKCFGDLFEMDFLLSPIYCFYHYETVFYFKTIFTVNIWHFATTRSTILNQKLFRTKALYKNCVKLYYIIKKLKLSKESVLTIVPNSVNLVN